MFETLIERLEGFSGDQLQSKELSLWIWYADKIPPHIGCSVDGFYFSLKANGKDILIPVEKVDRIILKKAIPFLLIQTDLKFTPDQVEVVYNAYQRATFEGISCLKPILELLQTPAQVLQIKDLIQYLESADRIKHIFGINLPSDYCGLREYGQTEIMERLRKLNHAKREENISEGC